MRYLKAFNIFLPFLLTIFSANVLLAQQPKMLRTIVIDAGHGGAEPGAISQYENSMKTKEKDITLAISLKLIAALKKEMPEVKIVPTRTTDVTQSVKEKAKIANDAKGDLFLCIHADTGPVATGKRQIGTKNVKKYKVTYTGSGKKRRKVTTPYYVDEPIYEYYKVPQTRQGTSVWIFAAHKTSDKLKAISNGVDDYQIENEEIDSANHVDFNSPQGRAIAQIYAKRYQEKSDRIAQMVIEEIERKGRASLGVNQRQVGIWVLQATNMPAILIETGFLNTPSDEQYLNSEKGQKEITDAIVKAVVRYKELYESGSTASN